MDLADAQAFIRDNHSAVIATFRKDGRPSLSPVTAGLDAEGRIIVSTRETAMKVNHLRRDPRVSVMVFTERFYGDFVQAEGIAEIIALPDAMDLLIDYYRDISGEHPDWDEYRAAMERDQRVIVRFAMERVGPTVSG